MKNKYMGVLFFIFLFLNIIDIITTIFIIKAESNILFVLTNNIWIPIILKIIIVAFCYIVIKRNIYKSNFNYYTIILVLVLGSFLLLMAQYFNIRAILNPVIMEQGINTTKTERIISYSVMGGIFYFLPMLMSLISFWIYDKSTKYRR